MVVIELIKTLVEVMDKHGGEVEVAGSWGHTDLTTGPLENVEVRDKTLYLDF